MPPDIPESFSDEELARLALQGRAPAAAPVAAPAAAAKPQDSYSDEELARLITGSTGAAPEPISKAESFGRGLLSGATFGFEDNMGLADKERQEAAQKANPWTSFAGDVTGAALPMAGAALLPGGQPVAAGRAAGLLARGAGLVRSALVPAQEINTLTKATLQGGKLGLTYGTLSGAGHADSPEGTPLGENLLNRAKGAGTGALAGVVLGAPLGAAGHGIMGAVGAGLNRAVPSLNQILIRAETPELQGIRDLLRNAGYDGIGIEDLKALGQKIAANPKRYEGMNIVEMLEVQPLVTPEGGLPTMPPTVTPNLSGWSQDVANTPGAGQTAAAQAFASRKNELGSKIVADVDELFQPNAPTTLAEGLSGAAGRRLDEPAHLSNLVDAAFGSSAAKVDAGEAALAASKKHLNKRYGKMEKGGDGEAPPLLSIQQLGITNVANNNPLMRSAMQYAADADATRLASNPGQEAVGTLYKWGQGNIGNEVITFSPQNLLDMHHSLVVAAKPNLGDPQKALHAGVLKNWFSGVVDKALKGHEALRAEYHIFKRTGEASELGAKLASSPSNGDAMSFVVKLNREIETAAREVGRRTEMYDRGMARHAAGEVKGRAASQYTNMSNALRKAEGLEQVQEYFRRSFGQTLKEQIESGGPEKAAELVSKWLTQGGQKQIRRVAGERAGGDLIRELQVMEARRMGKQLGLKAGSDEHKSLLALEGYTRDGNAQAVEAFKQGWAERIKNELAATTEGQAGPVVRALLSDSGKSRIMQLLGPEKGEEMIARLYNKDRILYQSKRLYGNSDTAYKQGRNRASEAFDEAVSSLMHFNPWGVLRGARHMLQGSFKQARADQANQLLARQGPDEVQGVIQKIVDRSQLANTAKNVTVNGVKLNTGLTPLGPMVSTVPGQPSPLFTRSDDRRKKRQP